MDAPRILQAVRCKREGAELSSDECQLIASAIADGRMTDAQVGAFAMAVFCRGMTLDESAALTQGMTATGWCCDWSAVPLDGPALDKHSTGGLGDIVSFLLAPMIAACGGYVPMISGRSLGHTGGTIDKLESIAGYDPFPNADRFQRIVKQCGLAIVGQTGQLVPADQRLYAIRDQTATVESLPLIAASILSKKLAESLDGLVIDLKVGSGAFMRNREEGMPLRDALQGVADRCGLNCRVLFTAMDQPLANCVGDGVEMREAIRFLTGERRTERLHNTVVELAAELLLLGGLAEDLNTAKSRLDRALDAGEAAERFQAMVSALGGSADLMTNPEGSIDLAPLTEQVSADRAGNVASIDGPRLGNVVHELASNASGVSFDHRIGIAELCELGQQIEAGQPLAYVHARTDDELQVLAKTVQRAVAIKEH